MSNNTSFNIDLSKGKARQRIDKMMADLSVSNYRFENGSLCVPENTKFVKPDRELTGAEKSLIENLRLTAVRPVYA